MPETPVTQEIAKALESLPWGNRGIKTKLSEQKSFLAAPSIRVLETLSQDPGQKLS